MDQQQKIWIYIDDHHTLDAGSWQTILDDEQTPYRLITPPKISMYEQVINYLAEATKNQKVPPKSQIHFGEIALATMLVCIRWGSYFAILVNRNVPQWTDAYDPEIGCIQDPEMARMNIETSAALEMWLDLLYKDFAQFRKLVKAAIQLLPSPIEIPDPKTNYNQFRLMSTINSVAGRQRLMEYISNQVGEDWFNDKVVRISENLLRSLANGVINGCWRNSELENIHAGKGNGSVPILQRCLTQQQEQNLFQDTIAEFVPAMRGLVQAFTKPTEELFDELVLPYAYTFNPPEYWTLHEQTRPVELYGPEPTL